MRRCDVALLRRISLAEPPIAQPGIVADPRQPAQRVLIWAFLGKVPLCILRYMVERLRPVRVSAHSGAIADTAAAPTNGTRLQRRVRWLTSAKPPGSAALLYARVAHSIRPEGTAAAGAQARAHAAAPPLTPASVTSELAQAEGWSSDGKRYLGAKAPDRLEK